MIIQECKLCKKKKPTNLIDRDTRICFECLDKKETESDVNVHIDNQTKSVDVHTKERKSDVDAHIEDYHTKPRKTIRLKQKFWIKLENLSMQLNISSLSETIEHLIDKY